MTEPETMPRVTAHGDDIAVTLDGVTLVTVEFTPPGRREGPLQLREQFLARYAEAIASLEQELTDSLRTRSEAAATRPSAASSGAAPLEVLMDLEDTAERLQQNMGSLDADAFEAARAAAPALEGSAQERCVRMVVGPGGDIKDVKFGPTAGQADDLGRQVVRAYRRAITDVRLAVAQQDEALAPYVTPFNDETEEVD